MKTTKKLSIQGSALIVAVIFSILIAMGTLALQNFQYLTHKTNHKSFEGNKARYIAESGIMIALDELNKQTASPFSGAGDFTWVSAGSNIYTLTRSDIGTVNITVDYSDPSAVIIKCFLS